MNPFHFFKNLFIKPKKETSMVQHNGFHTDLKLLLKNLENRTYLSPTVGVEILSLLNRYDNTVMMSNERIDFLKTSVGVCSILEKTYKNMHHDVSIEDKEKMMIVTMKMINIKNHFSKRLDAIKENV